MCNQATLTAKQKRLEEHYGAEMSVNLLYQPRYHIKGYQHSNLYIITQEYPSEILPAIWGFIPEWEIQNMEYFEKKYGDFKGYWNNYDGLNTRSESALTHSFFKDATLSKRCLILADGFIEPKNKIPQFCYIPDKEYERKLFAFAGIYSNLDSDLFSCSILTTKTNEFFSEIHHRMPIVLDEELNNEWLRPDLKREQIQEFLKHSFTSDTFECYPISRKVYTKEDFSEDPSILNPVYPPPTLFE